MNPKNMAAKLKMHNHLESINRGSQNFKLNRLIRGFLVEFHRESHPEIGINKMKCSRNIFTAGIVTFMWRMTDRSQM